jgi:hypothetical protein
MNDKPSDTLAADLKKARDDAVAANIKVLENFYSFLISFALTQATYQLVLKWDESNDVSEIMGAIILYISFVVTIVPFYQGMNRFLYATHVVRPLEKPNSKSSPMLLDIYAFLVMSCLIFVMGRFLSQPYVFFYIWTALLIVDIVWTLIVWQVQDSRRPLWAFNNIKWLIAAWIYWGIVYFVSHSSCLDDEAKRWLPYGFVIFEIGRTYFDYKINWSFYFPAEYRGQ